MSTKKGNLYLIPTPLGESDPTNTFTNTLPEVLNRCAAFIVEKEKTARRCLIRMGIERPIGEVKLLTLNKHTAPEDTYHFLDAARRGEDVGLMSEAGSPGVADPGAAIVGMAHREGIRVVPLIGPSSLLLALMASGMNGQSFAFQGYLPRDQRERIQRIKQLDREVQVTSQTQLFIETPYRNRQMFEDLVKTCHPETKLCVACNLTQPDEYIKTREIADWHGKKPDLNKKPTVFLLGM